MGGVKWNTDQPQPSLRYNLRQMERMNGFDMLVPLTRAGQKHRTELECAEALGLVEQSGAGAEAGVEAALGQEFIVLAAFDDFAVVKDEDLVGVADGG